MAKKKTLKTTSLPEPQSRNEALLQNILGADYDLGEPRSRNEALLMQIAEKIGQLSEPYTAGQYININDKEISSTLQAGENITIDEDGKINAAGGEKTIYDLGLSMEAYMNGETMLIGNFRLHLDTNARVTFAQLVNKINAGEKIKFRLFDIGRNTTSWSKSGNPVLVSEFTWDSVRTPKISGVFSTLYNGSKKFVLVNNELDTSMNENAYVIRLSLNGAQYKIFS